MCDCSWAVVSERVRVCVMGVGVGIALTSRLSDAKSALCRSSAVIDAYVKVVVQQEPNQKISSKSYQRKQTRLASTHGLVELKRDSWRRLINWPIEPGFEPSIRVWTIDCNTNNLPKLLYLSELSASRTREPTTLSLKLIGSLRAAGSRGPCH